MHPGLTLARLLGELLEELRQAVGVVGGHVPPRFEADSLAFGGHGEAHLPVPLGFERVPDDTGE